MWLNKMLNKNLKTLIQMTFHLTVIYPSNYITDNTSPTSDLLRTSVKESIFFPVYLYFSSMYLLVPLMLNHFITITNHIVLS